MQRQQLNSNIPYVYISLTQLLYVYNVFLVFQLKLSAIQQLSQGCLVVISTITKEGLGSSLETNDSQRYASPLPQSAARPQETGALQQERTRVQGLGLIRRECCQ